MEFGVPKEVRDLETRVGLTPAGVVDLVQAGHTVYVEQGAGWGFSDAEYQEAGAKIVYSPAEAYGRADVVVKVTRPILQEYPLFRAGQVIFSFLSLPVASPDLANALIENQITAIAYEMIESQDGIRFVLLPTSEVAGRLAPIISGNLLTSGNNGRGVLLSGVPGVPPAAIVIVGGGVLGLNAARAFVGLGAQVTLLDKNPHQLQQVDDRFGGRVTTMICNEYNLHKAVRFADVLVGAASVSGKRAPILVTRQMVESMQPGSVILDFAIDHGGCIATSRPTTLRDPVYTEANVIHYCVPNTAALTARTASYALTNALLPSLLNLGEYGLPDVFQHDPTLAKGVNLYQGQIANVAIATALGRDLEIILPITSAGNENGR